MTPTPPTEHDPATPGSGDSDGWFDRPENARRLFRWLAGATAAFVLIDVVFRLTGFDKHPYFGWQQWPGFYAVYAFVGCAVLVLVAGRIWRPLVKRDQDYYDRHPDTDRDSDA